MCDTFDLKAAISVIVLAKFWSVWQSAIPSLHTCSTFFARTGTVAFPAPPLLVWVPEQEEPALCMFFKQTAIKWEEDTRKHIFLF